jgi:hypothetical protein
LLFFFFFLFNQYGNQKGLYEIKWNRLSNGIPKKKSNAERKNNSQKMGAQMIPKELYTTQSYIYAVVPKSGNQKQRNIENGLNPSQGLISKHQQPRKEVEGEALQSSTYTD